MTDPFVDYLRAPDRRRLSRFIVAYTEAVSRLVRRVVNCPEASRDVVQDVFLRLAESSVRVEDVPQPRAYVLRAALNTARNHLRSEKARLHHEREASTLRPAVSRSAAEEATEREAVDRLYRSIDALPEPLRVVIHLRAVEGLSYREIALVTGLPGDTVGSRIRRAREELRRLLGSGQLAVAWASLEPAREHGWFPVEADGLSRAAVARLAKTAKPPGTTAPAVGILVLASLALLFLSIRGPPDSTREIVQRRGTAVVPPAPRSAEPARAASLGQGARPEKPLAPLVAGAETGSPGVAGDEPVAESAAKSPAADPGGGETMNSRQTLLASAVLAIGAAAAAGGAETGDFDGDGRLTIADVLHLEDLLELADGSLEAFEALPCYLEQATIDPERTLWLQNMVPSSVFLESLRRGVDGSLAHWDSVWPEDVVSEPLPEDARCEIELLSSTAPGGADDRARIHFRLAVHAPVRAFSVVLDPPRGLLEAPPGGFTGIGPFFDATRWRRKYEVLGANSQMHRFGDLEVAVTTQAYLITAGRYVVSYDLLDNRVWDDIAPGEYLVTIEARISLHTPAGTYPIKVLPASEVLFSDGMVMRPVVLADRSELTIEGDVTEGLDDGVPPLRLDPENRRVLGDIEFRVVDGEGNAPEPGEPVIEAFNDEEAKVRLQIRTEVPLNRIRYDLRWLTGDGLDLICESPPAVVFARPDGTPYQPFTLDPDDPRPQDTVNRCSSILGTGRAEALYQLAGADNSRLSRNQADRPLEYFRPLGEWLDIAEFKLTVPDEAAGGGEIHFSFATSRAEGSQASVSFSPYEWFYPCNPHLWPEDPLYWRYNVVYHDSFIRVLGEADPPVPPDLGIRFALGGATGAPGDLVEVPIEAASRFPLRRMRLALALPETLTIESVEMDILDLRTFTVVQRLVHRAQNFSSLVCTDEDGDGRFDLCTGGVPIQVRFQDTDPSSILLDIYPGDPSFMYPGERDGELAEIGRLRLRIAENAEAGRATLAAARIPWVDNTFEALAESGGNTRDRGPYSPANEVAAGTVVIEGGSPRREFVRGDANADGGINIADAVLVLNSLFTASGRLGCEDAADADDNGSLNITDPILLLDVLFGGGGALPPPSACAHDPTPDPLGCEEGCDGRA